MSWINSQKDKNLPKFSQEKTENLDIPIETEKSGYAYIRKGLRV